MAEETILLIDADEATEQDLVSTLEAEGYLVFTAAGIEMAVRMAQKVQPALICLNPAPTGGLEICRELRDKTLMKSVPIIVTTSYAGSMDPRYTAQYGIVDFLKIPVSRAELLEKIERYIIEGIPDHPVPVNEHAGAEGDAWEVSQEPAGEPDEGSAAEDAGREELRAAASIEEEERVPDTFALPERKTEKFMSRKPLPPRRSGRKAGSRSKWPLLVLILVLVTAAGVGIGMYGFQYFRQDSPGITPPAGIPVSSGKPERDGAVPLQEDPGTVPAQAQQPEQPVAVEETGKPAGVRPPVKAVYSVQAGAFKSEPNAESLAAQFRGKGHEAVVRKGLSKDNETVYRVLLGQYGERKDAAAAASALERSANMKVTVYGE